MSIRVILFDLDGTLLPMDQELFTKCYFKGLCKKTAPYGYAPEELVNAVWAGTKAMVTNDGTGTCEQAFWNCFAKVLGESIRDMEPVFHEYYTNEFQEVKDACGYNPEAARLIADLKAKGYRVVLATNPLFPPIATHSRVRWAGMDTEDFEWTSATSSALATMDSVPWRSELNFTSPYFSTCASTHALFTIRSQAFFSWDRASACSMVHST